MATKTKVTADEWPRIAAVVIEAELTERRVHAPDIVQAAEMAAQTFRSVLESKGYEVEMEASVDYGYRALREPVGVVAPTRMTRTKPGA